MEYLSNWTDISSIQQSGWSGSKNFTDNCVVLTATNGWRTFGWSFDDIEGKNVSIEFDYIFTDVTNWSSFGVYIVNTDTVGYGVPAKNLEKSTDKWIHFKSNLSSAKKFIGINIRGTDNSGDSIVMKLQNIRIHSDEPKNFNISKNGTIITNMLLETKASVEGKSVSIGKDYIAAREIYEF